MRKLMSITRSILPTGAGSRQTTSSTEALAISSAVTAVCVPDGVDGSKLVSRLRDCYGVTIAGGQSELKGKIFRIAHMGYIGIFDIAAAISAIGSCLSELGYKGKAGSGARVVEERIKLFL